MQVEKGVNEANQARLKKQMGELAAKQSKMVESERAAQLASQQLTTIPTDLTLRDSRSDEHFFQKMQKDVKLIRNPHRSADFYVLKAPEIPSVLLELGYLSNREDEALLNSADWREKAVQRTFDAIQLFFKSRIGIR